MSQLFLSDFSFVLLRNSISPLFSFILNARHDAISYEAVVFEGNAKVVYWLRDASVLNSAVFSSMNSSSTNDTMAFSCLLLSSDIKDKARLNKAIQRFGCFLGRIEYMQDERDCLLFRICSSPSPRIEYSYSTLAYMYTASSSVLSFSLSLSSRLMALFVTCSSGRPVFVDCFLCRSLSIINISSRINGGFSSNTFLHTHTHTQRLFTNAPKICIQTKQEKRVLSLVTFTKHKHDW